LGSEAVGTSPSAAPWSHEVTVVEAKEVEKRLRDSDIVHVPMAIEEHEAHLHPYMQRLKPISSPCWSTSVPPDGTALAEYSGPAPRSRPQRDFGLVVVH
jgi:hypothetical protein